MDTKMLDKAIEKAGKSLIYLQDTLQKMPFDFLEDGDDVRVDIEDYDSIINRIVTYMEDLEDKVEASDIKDDPDAQDLLKRIELKFETVLELMQETNKDIIRGTADASPASPQLTQVENVHWYYKQAITQLEASYAHYQTAKDEELMH